MLLQSKFVVSMIGIGLGAVIVGLLLRGTNNLQSSTQVSESTNSTAQNQETSQQITQPDATLMPEIVETPQPTAVVSKIPNDNVVWHDTFDDVASGWQPKYEVTQAYYGMSMPQRVDDKRLYAWNGYEKGSYHVYLPGLPSLRGETATMLWDFNGANPLPTYPYRVRADITVNPAGNAMLLLDYSGEFTAIERGEGVAVVWGHSDGLSYQFVDVWKLVVYEFRNGRTWQLGCTEGEISEISDYITAKSVAVVEVDVDAIRVKLFSSDELVHEASCSRVTTRDAGQQRYLGLGAIYARTLVPAAAYNTVAFDDIYVMTGISEQPMTITTVPTEINGGCVPAWVGWYENGGPIDIVESLDSRTDCRNGYANRSSDFPGFGPKRIIPPANDDLEGDWFCDGYDGALITRFYIGQSSDGISDWDLFIDDRALYVYYSEGGEYIVTSTTSGGNNTTFQSVDYVRIGDGIGVLDQHHFTFSYDSGRDQIKTNWTTKPCRRK